MNDEVQANRALRVLAGAKDAVVGAHDEPTLLEAMCRVVVEAGGYAAAWVDYVDDASPARRRTMAACGIDRAAVAGRELSLPLRVGADTVGELGIAAAEDGVFGSGETALLGEAAVDVAYAIASLRSRLEQKRLESSLKASEERYRSVVEDQTEVICRMALDGTFTFVNDVFCRLFGKTREELLGRRWQPLALAEDIVAVNSLLATLSPACPVVVSENRVRIGSGETRWMQFVNRAVFDAVGRITEIQAVGRDVNERRLAEDKLRELSVAVEQSVESIVITNTNAEITYVNDAFLNVTGYTRDEVLGMNPRVLQSGKTPEATYAAMWATLDAGQSWRGEFVNRRKDGSEYHESAVISPVRRMDGSISHYVAVKEDITARKLLQQDLEARMRELEAARKAADAASVAKSAFLANMSHEIRTPLNAILGLAQVLEPQLVEPEHRDLVERIRDAGAVLLRSLNDVLDLSKIEAGQLEIERQPFEVGRVLANVGHLMEAMALGKGLGLRIDAGSFGRLSVRGDAVRVEQVLLNLTSNAIKFTGDGEIVLRVGARAAGAGALWLRFEVQDRGIGIAADKAATLFKPFTQADSGITRRYGGTGLGLSISKRLVELMGGTIGFDSTEGVGSTFWFELPFEPVEAAADAAPAKAAPPPAPGGGRALDGVCVLVVDDSRMNLDVVERLLSREGAEVALASDGQQALAMLEAQPDGFDVVLMDVQMPVMDGLTATRAIRSHPRISHLPVIALSAGVLAEERSVALSAGADDFLPKPIELAQLLAIVGKHARRAPATS